MKKIWILPLMALSLSLSGCSHNNELDKYSKDDAAQALQTAAVYADKHSGLDLPGHNGRMYYLCMSQDKEYTPKQCDQTYKLVLTAIHKDKRFKGVDLRDIKNPVMFSNLKDNYFNIMFFDGE